MSKEKRHIEVAFTRPVAETGVRVDVIAPDGKTKLGSLTVRGADCKDFQNAVWMKSRKQIEIMSLPEAEQQEALQRLDNETLATLVAGWTFADPCTTENIVRLFENAPYVKRLVDDTAGKRELFWKPPEGS